MICTPASHHQHHLHDQSDQIEHNHHLTAYGHAPVCLFVHLSFCLSLILSLLNPKLTKLTSPQVNLRLS